MINRGSKILFLIFYFILLIPNILKADNEPLLSTKIKFEKQKETVYYFLQSISEQSESLFIYDSHLIDNNRTIKIPQKEYKLEDAIRLVINNQDIEIKIIDSYIILLPKTKKIVTSNTNESTIVKNHITLRGSIYDSETNEALPYSSIGIVGSNIGTVANNDGEFLLTIPNSLANNNLVISHIGYKKQEVNASICSDKHINLYLDPHITNLSEAVVSIVDPYEYLIG